MALLRDTLRRFIHRSPWGSSFSNQENNEFPHQPFYPRLSINYNSPEEQEKIKEYIESLKNDILNGVIHVGHRIGERVDGQGEDLGSVTEIMGTVDLNESTIQPTPYFTVRWVDSSSTETPQVQYEKEMEEAIKALKIVDRECWLCGNSINYKECCEANSKMIHKEVSALWNSPIAKIACCSCTDKLNKLVPRIDDISEILIKKIYNQRYNIKEDFITNDKERISDIKIRFGDNWNNYIFIHEKQFRNLLKYKILDFPIELEDEVDELEVEMDDYKVSNEYNEIP